MNETPEAIPEAGAGVVGMGGYQINPGSGTGGCGVFGLGGDQIDFSGGGSGFGAMEASANGAGMAATLLAVQQITEVVDPVLPSKEEMQSFLRAPLMKMSFTRQGTESMLTAE
jgi:hypothetical protein